MPDATRRQFPRLAVAIPADLEVRPAARAAKKRVLPTLITTLSCDGAGLELDNPQLVELRTGLPTSFEIVVDGRSIALRSQVAWFSASQSERTKIGLQLLLPFCSRDARCTYSEWIISQYYRDAAIAGGAPG
jgi:hypothetical protein